MKPIDAVLVTERSPKVLLVTYPVHLATKRNLVAAKIQPNKFGIARLTTLIRIHSVCQKG